MRLVLVAIALLAPLPVAAESHEGIVRELRIDSDADSPLCATTSPRMPAGARACIYPNRRYYQEMKELLFRALDGKYRCTFSWTLRDTVTNQAQIASISCAAP